MEHLGLVVALPAVTSLLWAVSWRVAGLADDLLPRTPAIAPPVAAPRAAAAVGADGGHPVIAAVPVAAAPVVPPAFVDHAAELPDEPRTGGAAAPVSASAPASTAAPLVALPDLPVAAAAPPRPVAAPAAPSWDGVERRSGLDRRWLDMRHDGAERRRTGGRRHTDRVALTG